MSELELALEDCLARMELAGESLKECLSHYPELSGELEPLLSAAQDVGGVLFVEPAAAFKAKLRSDLIAHVRSNKPAPIRWNYSPTLRYAVSFAVLVVALVTSGTALAQRALPGDVLYGWKLGSESVWRRFQADAVDADLELTRRRLDELKAVKGFANLELIGIEAYGDVLEHLGTQFNNNPGSVVAIQDELRNQRDVLEEIYEDNEALPSLDALFDALTNPNKPDNANSGQGIYHGNAGGRGWEKHK